MDVRRVNNFHVDILTQNKKSFNGFCLAISFTFCEKYCIILNVMNDYKTRKVEYAEWGWGRGVPYFCATTLHHTTELIRLEKGDGEIYINGQSYTLKMGNLYIVRPLTLHAIRKTGDVTPVVDFVKFDLRRLAENCPQDGSIGDYLHFLNDKNAPCVLDGGSEHYNAKEVIEPLFAENNTREQTQQAIFNMLKTLHGQRLNSSPSNITEERQHFAVQTAVEYLASHYAEQIKVTDVANAMGYDEFYAMRLFKRFCGWSIVDYLNGVRTACAKRLLEETDDSSRKIAESVGYQSASYFNRQFKKTFGLTPSEFRAQTN